MMSLVLLPISVLAGFIGSILGLGGGVIIVPVLTLWFGIDIRYAVAASLISIIATSSGAAASFLKDHLTNLRLAIVLEIGTVFGAMTGFMLSTSLKSSALFLCFGGFLLFSAVMMLRQKKDPRAEVNHPWSDKLGLHSKFPEKGEWIFYKVSNVPFGLISMYVAGIFSALLGIGSGIFKIMAMDGAMKVPMKVSSATSNFMIGVTASASAGAYFLRGDIKPEIASPVALGIIVGAWIGARVMPKLNAAVIRKFFIVVMVIVATQMIMKGIRG
ncbi:MAG: sulfite exporter TauE/SafE family protein [Bdellovibrionales bacterium]|nr:sulfite exporter TauE/SafE family protein [Bdellovibrionales bacterium]